MCELSANIQELMERFQLFCDTESSRYVMQSPFFLSGKLYATDGRVAVRCPCDMPDSQVEGRLPPVESAFADYEFADLRPLGSDQQLKSGRVPCRCASKELECETCGGTGDIECDSCGQDTNCGDCHGDGYVRPRCGECDQNRQTVAPKFEEIDGLIFPLKTMGNIRALGNVRYTTDKESALLFECGEIQGIVISPGRGGVVE